MCLVVYLIRQLLHIGCVATTTLHVFFGGSRVEEALESQVRLWTTVSKLYIPLKAGIEALPPLSKARPNKSGQCCLCYHIE